MTEPADWWYVRAYPGRLDLMDEASRRLVPWLARAAAEEGAVTWFFMRYVDTTGHHLRLRLRAVPDAVDRLHVRLPEVDALLSSIRGPGTDIRLVAGAAPLGRPGARRVRATLYSPELRKYGGRPGIRLAEQLFTDSSRWYAEHDLGALRQSDARAALAVRFLRDTVATAAPGREAEFWAAHRAQWGWHLRSAAPTKQSFRELAATASATVARTPLPLSTLIGERVAAVVSTLDMATDAAPAVPRLSLLLNYLHMELNRWGFLPAEECLLGMLAAAEHRSRPLAAPGEQESTFQDGN